MRLSHYLSIIGAIYMTPMLNQMMPEILYLLGAALMLASVAVHVYFGRDCEMGDDK